ncbi:hypothetical protein [Pseudomonas sp. ANT_H12B]|uniref:hypothetical protein n=1 Tax=Pseudomonas sp. ANT_H12B TaxID=2597348 RepID=UPI0011EFF8BD|nr:hypothetical protein [Pseudomonas sp. ANT_H12B]KAA0968830.1 hypothetical protein FQ185_19610 [Pseudomonas sp. ANT_H12B]
MNSQIRLATPEDTAAISQVIIQSLRQSNARDYSPEIIAQVEKSFSAEAICTLLSQRQVFVANIEALRVRSSITAEGFYSRLGYRKVHDEFHGAERTIIMQRRLPRLNSRHANELARDIGQ